MQQARPGESADRQPPRTCLRGPSLCVAFWHARPTSMRVASVRCVIGGALLVSLSFLMRDAERPADDNAGARRAAAQA